VVWGKARLGKTQHDGRRSAYQGRRPLQFCREIERASLARLFAPNATKSAPPPPLARCSGFASAALTAAPPTVVEQLSLMMRTRIEEVLMNMIQTVGTASDRVMAALISGLELEFGRGAGEALAHRFLDAEEIDFHWDARVQERWIGTYESIDDDDLELDRIAVFGRLDGCWFVAMMIVDGGGNAHGMLGKRTFRRRWEAEAAFAIA
jgi:hypothetical protein